MNLTKEQLTEIGPFNIDDIPVLYDRDQDYMVKLFNIIPEHLKGLAISWGCSDTVFGDDVFVWFLETYYDMTPKDFYDSDLGYNFLKSKEVEIRLENDFKINGKRKNESSCR